MIGLRLQLFDNHVCIFALAYQRSFPTTVPWGLGHHILVGENSLRENSRY